MMNIFEQYADAIVEAQLIECLSRFLGKVSKALSCAKDRIALNIVEVYQAAAQETTCILDGRQYD
jgi:hypothetical protein